MLLNKRSLYVNFALGHWYYPLYLVDTRFLCWLFSRSNSLDYTRCCSHSRDYLAGAASSETLIPIIVSMVLVLEGVDEAPSSFFALSTTTDYGELRKEVTKSPTAFMENERSLTWQGIPPWETG